MSDLISRQAAIDELNQAYNLIDAEHRLKALPPVTPQLKMGHWEYVEYDNKPNIGNWHCSECRGICTEMHSIKDAYNYCPNCGAKMERLRNDNSREK